MPYSIDSGRWQFALKKSQERHVSCDTSTPTPQLSNLNSQTPAQNSTPNSQSLNPQASTANNERSSLNARALVPVAAWPHVSPSSRYKVTQLHRYRGKEVHRYRGTQVQSYTGTELNRYRGTQVHKYTGAQVQRYTGTQSDRYIGTEIHRYIGTQVHRHCFSNVFPASPTPFPTPVFSCRSHTIYRWQYRRHTYPIHSPIPLRACSHQGVAVERNLLLQHSSQLPLRKPHEMFLAATPQSPYALPSLKPRMLFVRTRFSRSLLLRVRDRKDESDRERERERARDSKNESERERARARAKKRETTVSRSSLCLSRIRRSSSLGCGAISLGPILLSWCLFS